ncbi:MAG TPA: fatty acid desaturase [Polyangiaceae bacterium]|nr:fatty acid desaturase [Polyangiaceae bacterium]
MKPRHSADYRTILWMLVFAPAVMAAQFVNPELIGKLTILSLYFGVSAAVIAHNHNHSPTFTSKRANSWFGKVLSIFYGYPTFAWIPTHNLNHHKLVNKPGDATITWRFTNRHNVLVAATYFFVSAWFQRIPTSQFIERAKAQNPKLHAMIRGQFWFWGLAHAGLLSLAIFLHGPLLGLKVWFFAVFVPALFALWTVHLFNYEQHVHTDPWSEYDHSRNFISPLLNFLLFNNGYHTAHHENAGLHWSQLPKLDAELAPRINPALREKSVWWYWFRQYVLAVFVPKLGTTQIGRAPFDTPNLDLRTDDVEAATYNASRA